MKLYKTNRLDSTWIIIATFSFSLFILAGTGCQTFPGFSNQEDSGKMSLKDAPSRKHQPRSLESLVRSQADLPSLPPSVRNESGTSNKGINIDDVGLERQSVHVEADMSIEEIANSDKKQLPDILESNDRLPGDVRPPFISPEAFLVTKETKTADTSPPVSATEPPKIQPSLEIVAPVSIAPQQQQALAPPQQKQTPSPPSPPSPPTLPTPPTPAKTASDPTSGEPILTLTAKSQGNAETKLSDEIDLLLGPAADTTPPSEFDANSFSIGDQASQALPKPAAVDPNSETATTDSSRNIQAANRISGVEHAAWGGSNSSVAEQISTVDEPVGTAENVQVAEPATNASTDETNNQPRQLTWQEQLKISIELLDKQIQTQSGSDSAALDTVRMQLMQIVAGTSGGEPFNVTGLPENEATFWQHQLSSIQVMLNGTPDEDMSGNVAALQRRRATTAARQLELAANQLAGDASLQVNNATFCNQVRGFGQFTAAKNVFVPTQQVLIYCEIANYALKALPADGTGEDSQLAELRGRFEIVDENNRVVHQHQYQSVEDKTRWRRKDFYMYFPITFPQLAPGRYRVQLSIEDLVGKKFASVHPDMEFTIAPAQPRSGVAQQKTADGSTGGPVR